MKNYHTIDRLDQAKVILRTKKRGETTGEGSGEKKMLNATIYMYNVLHGIALRIFTHFCLTLDSDATAWYAHSRVYNSIHTF